MAAREVLPTGTTIRYGYLLRSILQGSEGQEPTKLQGNRRAHTYRAGRWRLQPGAEYTNTPVIRSRNLSAGLGFMISGPSNAHSQNSPLRARRLRWQVSALTGRRAEARGTPKCVCYIFWGGNEETGGRQVPCSLAETRCAVLVLSPPVSSSAQTAANAPSTGLERLSSRGFRAVSKAAAVEAMIVPGDMLDNGSVPGYNL